MIQNKKYRHVQKRKLYNIVNAKIVDVVKIIF